VPLPLSKKNDQVFQLSLTELAFMLVFLMMLITGWMVLDADKRAHETTEKLKQTRLELAKTAEAAQLRQKSEKSVQTLLDAYKGGTYRPDDVIADLRRCTALEPENRDMKLKIAELEQQIGSLAAFLQAMKTLAGKDATQAVADELATAMAFKKAFEDAAGKRLDSASAIKQGWNCVTAQAKSDALEKERQNLINQVTFLRHQMESMSGNISGNKGGFGPPPCWVANGGRSQRLIAVEVTDQGLVVRPGWPAEREDEAMKIPNIKVLTGGGKPLSAAEFHAAARPVLEWSKGRSPECRYYASVTVSATRVDTSVAGQNAVFDHFFPYGKVTVQKSAR